MNNKAKKQLKKANRLQLLGKQERKEPMLVLDEFFSNYHLIDLRTDLWEWLCSALTNPSGPHETGQARGNLIFLYENIGKLTEAAYLLQKKEERK
ncbi:hypothetical protein [Paraflavitalea sp. CAU 1676]|uniref:hypothetical protein n=1 Tax=Paraflavitalea sp. CAU 1676 TaxID=3032598 RepID=UPI0023DB3980|nr:hypothetical protein [Paraflavitalea sp. CAU 1676]MDF2192081.1 hypothetical protein [Paraflavitalea sp. CAU 1676]